MSKPWRATADGLVVVCRLTPKGGRDAIDGVATLSDGAVVLAARVREAPEDGRANEALCRLIAKAAGVSASRARLAAGAKSRIKQVALEGDTEALMAALERSLTPPS
jgi:uncharacterized protein YggU (UPF0235/DUF167 family)